ncbi:unnamed protein product [marine sediment metagenome]|uniref:Uncharacterized protein n=1 Tax=marine sediment metagenome TaxID=412755 RepID=X0ZIC7_9ZZZZ
MIEIDDKKYNIKNWDTLTIQEAEQLTNIELPEKMKELYTSGTKEKFEEIQKTITVEDEINFGEYAGEVLKIMSDIPDELLKYMQYFDRNDLYEHYCRDKIVSLIGGMPNYEPKKIESFEFNGETFVLPKSLKIFDKYLPNHSETSLTFVEGQGLFKAYAESQDKGNLKMLIAIYCRPEGEEYNEQKAIERSEQFNDLSMEVAWEVFFCITELLNISVKTINTSYQEILEKASASLN